MGVREIENLPEYGPYSAVVADDGDLSNFGFVRIEPPFLPGTLLEHPFEAEDYIGTNVIFTHHVTDKQSTTLEYEYESDEPDEVTGLMIAASATKTLLSDLGMFADKNNFIKYHEKFDINTEEE